MRSLRRLSAFSVGIFMLALMFSSGGMAAEAQADEVIHVVQPGDNLYRLSLRYDVSIQAIASANNISNINLIFVGQRLVIPDGDMPPTPEPPTPEPPQPPTPEPPPTGEITYTVVRGDTLSRIAQRFGTTWQILAQLNNIANPNRIFPGQVLRIPTDGTQPPGPPTPQPPQPPTPPPPSGTNFELGGHVFDFAVPDLMRLTGMTWAKRQFRWNGSDGPNVVQGLLDDARNKGFKLLLSVVGEPSQIAANPTQYYQNYANFVGGVAALGVEGSKSGTSRTSTANGPTGASVAATTRRCWPLPIRPSSAITRIRSSSAAAPRRQASSAAVRRAAVTITSSSSRWPLLARHSSWIVSASTTTPA